ncbi:hypothetical protein LINPERPRIM_LOCUS4207 [Linum perenne]
MKSTAIWIDRLTIFQQM